MGQHWHGDTFYLQKGHVLHRGQHIWEGAAGSSSGLPAPGVGAQPGWEQVGLVRQSLGFHLSAPHVSNQTGWEQEAQESVGAVLAGTGHSFPAAPKCHPPSQPLPGSLSSQSPSLPSLPGGEPERPQSWKASSGASSTWLSLAGRSLRTARPSQHRAASCGSHDTSVPTCERSQNHAGLTQRSLRGHLPGAGPWPYVVPELWGTLLSKREAHAMPPATEQICKQPYVVPQSDHKYRCLKSPHQARAQTYSNPS